MKIAVFIIIFFLTDVWSISLTYVLQSACENTTDIDVFYMVGMPPGEENQYEVTIHRSIPKYSNINLKFDTEAVVILDKSTKARISVEDDGTFVLRFYDETTKPRFTVRGPTTGTIPYFESININDEEYCNPPHKGFLDEYVMGNKVTAASHVKVPDGSCGRRRIDHTELIVNGAKTKPGDWPWHAAIYKVNRNVKKYICGGTLLSKTFVLTAAHCVTVADRPVLPETLNVVLGKFNLDAVDSEAQEILVQEITVHENFARKQLDNDIALLKLNTEVLFGDFVQPACLWYPTAVEKLPNRNVLKGTVVGWGFDENNSLSNQLGQAAMPLISDFDCIKKNPLFYSKVLNNRKFCAGFDNGTSACNGDSGGGLHVFVPDMTGNASPKAAGAWYVYGIVSLSLSQRDQPICDPSQYVIFTKVDEFRGWIQKYMK